VKGKTRALALAAITALVFALTTVMAVLGPAVIRWAFDQVNASGFSQVATQLLVGLVSALIFWAYLVMLYRFAPNDDGLRWRSSVLGALVGVVGWLIVANLFRLYVDHIGSYNRVYGSLGVVVIFLVFLYLTGLTVLIGGETSAELHDRSLADRTPDPVAPAFP
jgi:membrane protein